MGSINKLWTGLFALVMVLAMGAGTANAGEKLETKSAEKTSDAVKEPAFPGIKGEWRGFDIYRHGGRGGTIVVVPKKAAEGKPWVWRCAWCGVGAERTFPPSTAPEYPLDHFCLATFNEADDLHLATAARAYQRIDFVDSLDQYGPRGHRTGTGAVGSHLLPTFVNEAGRPLEGRRC
ncbi:MAG: hypothetical protein OSA89_20260 [Mariniblastus sp.]|nr:hypothetical protein [Mariniblastus sp.]